MAGLHRFANPGTFVRISAKVLPWLAGLTAILIGVGLYQALLVAPPEAYQGDVARIMYLHVPSAWNAMMIYGAMAVASAAWLIWKHPVADVAAQASAPIGAMFTLTALLTGSLWGKPTWGTFWVWDARITSVTIMLFIYFGYIALRAAIEDGERAAKAGAILALVGSVNLPIIHYSVVWWNTLHQPASVLRAGGPAIVASMLVPLLLLACGFTTYYLTLLIWRMQREIVGRRVRSLRVLQAQG